MTVRGTDPIVSGTKTNGSKPKGRFATSAYHLPVRDSIEAPSKGIFDHFDAFIGSIGKFFSDLFDNIAIRLGLKTASYPRAENDEKLELENEVKKLENELKKLNEKADKSLRKIERKKPTNEQIRSDEIKINEQPRSLSPAISDVSSIQEDATAQQDKFFKLIK